MVEYGNGWRIEYNQFSRHVTAEYKNELTITAFAHGSVYARDHKRGAQVFHAGDEDNRVECTGLAKNGAREPWTGGKEAMRSCLKDAAAKSRDAYEILKGSPMLHVHPILTDIFGNVNRVLEQTALHL